MFELGKNSTKCSKPRRVVEPMEKQHKIMSSVKKRNYFCLRHSLTALERLLLLSYSLCIVEPGSSDSSLLFQSSLWLFLLLSVFICPLAVCFAVVYSIIIDHFGKECNSCIIQHIHMQHLCGWQC